MVFSHAFAGAIIGKYINDKFEVSSEKRSLIYFLTILGSILPDFDLLLTIVFSNLHHRTLVTHSLIFYSFTFFVAFFALKKEYKIYEIALFLGVLSHLLIDFLVGGLVLFAPITYKVFGLPIYFISVTKYAFAANYLKSNYIVYEAILFLVYCFYVYKNDNNFVARKLPIFLFFVACFAFAAFAIL